MVGAMHVLSTSIAGPDQELYTRLDLSWKDFFREPSKWWDNRSSKRSPRQPDFKHKLTTQPLWMHSRHNPPWVKDELVIHGYAAEHYIEKDKTAIAGNAFSPSIIWDCCKNKDLLRGTQIHHELQERGLLDAKYSDALVTMYAKCGEPQKARALLDMHNCTNVVPWTALIASYARLGQGDNAFDCFEQMQCKGVSPNAVTFVCILKACTVTGALDMGKQIHDEISRQGLLDHNIVLGNALVDMYAKCGALHQAQNVLDKLPSRNAISWNGLMVGYAQKGRVQQAFECYDRMQREGIPPDAVTYMGILKACATAGAFDKGKQIHHEISRQGLLVHSLELGNALVDMYAKCGALLQAQCVLKELPSRNVVSWNALITGYAQKGQSLQALECLKQMQHEGMCPDAVTYVCLLKASAMVGVIDEGKKIHDMILRQGGLLEHNIALGNALVDMYAKCGALSQAQSVLEKLPARDVISWSALIAGYAQKGQGQDALECFERMQCDGIHPNAVTYVSILQACAVVGAIDKGKKIHDDVLRQGLLEHNVELGGALVDMYAKCGDLPKAKNILENLPAHNVISWNALLAGYVQHGQGREALKCFKKMHHEGIPPNTATYVCIVKACAILGSIEKGKKIHDEILRQGLLEHSIELGGAIVDMYAKCGALTQAQSVLEKLPSRNTVMWNALITGYAQEGQSEQAFKCFEQMQYESILPDSVTFLCLLNLCSHLGMVEKGQEIFDSMGARYGLKPDLECYTCMVDLLGRAGHLVKAVEVIQEMPFSADSAMWLCLLGACRKWVDVGVGTWAFDHVVEIDKCDGAAYAQMADIYAAAGMPEKAKDIEAMRIKNKAWKQPGRSSWTDLEKHGAMQEAKKSTSS